MLSSQQEKEVQNLGIMHETCEDTGCPFEHEKSVGPTTQIDFLGIELDSDEMEIRFPADKLKRLVQR